MAETRERNTDIWLVLVILVMILSFGGALWLSAKSVLARLDEMDVRHKSSSSTVESELFELRKELQDLKISIKPGAKSAAVAAKTTNTAQPAAR